MCAHQIQCTTKEAIIKHLRTHLEEESDQLKEYMEAVKTLSQEVKALTEQVKKLEGATYRAEELTKANAIQTVEVTSLRESMNRAKANTAEEYEDLQPFFNLLGSQYGEGFEDFKKQAIARSDDEVVEVDDVVGDTPKNTVAPQVVEGDSQPQVEETTANVENPNPATQKKIVESFF